MRARLFLAAIFVAALALSAHAATMIYYDTAAEPWITEHEGVVMANMLVALAGHFDTDIDSADIADYQAGGMDAYDHVFYIGTEYFRPIPDAFFADLATGDHRLMWIGQKLDYYNEYLDGPGTFGFESVDYNLGTGRDRVLYKGQETERVPDFSFFEVSVTGSPTVYSYYIPEGSPDTLYPHFLCGDYLCYMSDIPFWYEGEDDRMFVLADMLHEFYQVDHNAVGMRALVRFEELVPALNPADHLQDINDALEALDVPFSILVTPVMVDPNGMIGPPDSEYHFEDDPELVALIEHMLDHGGTLVMAGVTGQYGPDEPTGGFEFTSSPDPIPVPEDSESWVRTRLEWGLSEFDAVGLTPEMWRTPWDVASHGDYMIFADYFDFYNDRPLVFSVPHNDPPTFGTYYDKYSWVTMPYESYTSPSGMGVLPENLLCYFPGVEGYELEDMLARAEKLSIVRDAIASFCVYDGITVEEIEGAVGDIEDMGFEFMDPHDVIGDDDTGDDDTGDDDADDDADDDTADDDTGDDDADDDVDDDDDFNPPDDDDDDFTDDDDDAFDDDGIGADDDDDDEGTASGGCCGC
ncbi:MAG: DUF2334 domain-containing protein [Deltaproteobacteria bacterium]|nr:DUF2334 domain-containing protein [Deltaproteobacteria bacterium]